MLRTSCTSYIRMARGPPSFPGTIEDLCILFSCLTFGGLQAFAIMESWRCSCFIPQDGPATAYCFNERDAQIKVEDICCHHLAEEEHGQRTPINRLGV